MATGWKRLKHVSLSSAADTIDSGAFDVADLLRVVIYTSGTNTETQIRFNSDTGNNYSSNRESDGGNEADFTSQSMSKNNATGDGLGTVMTATIYNRADKEKQAFCQQVASEADGAANAPRRSQGCLKWANTSDRITSIQVVNNYGSGNTFAAGSSITVFGATDDTVTDEKTTLTNVPAGTRYEETDTRKIYRWKAGATVDYTAPYDNSSSWTQQGSWWSIDTTNEEADFTNGGTNSSNRVYTTMDITLNNSQWVCDFTFTTGGGLRTCRMVCLDNDTNYPSGGTNGIEFHIDTSGTTHIKSGGTLSSNAHTVSTNSTYYLRLMRTSSTNARLQVFSDSARTTQLGSTIDLSVSSSLTGIKYLQHASHTSGGSSSGGNWSISNLKIYNNKTASDIDASWKERGTA